MKLSYNVEMNKKKEVCLISLQPNNFRLEPTTVWSFPDRGSWATHSGKYRGNWSPYVPRNLILRYSNPSDWVLDQFMGSGTTLVEAKLLNRHAVGVDINPQSVSISETNLQFRCETNSKSLHEMEMLQICILSKIVELILSVRIRHMPISSNTAKG